VQFFMLRRKRRGCQAVRATENAEFEKRTLPSLCKNRSLGLLFQAGTLVPAMWDFGTVARSRFATLALSSRKRPALSQGEDFAKVPGVFPLTVMHRTVLCRT